MKQRAADRAPEPDDLTEDERAALEDPNNAGNPAAVKRKKAEAIRSEAEMGEVVAALLSTPAGRKFMAYLLFDVCGIYRQTENAAYDTNALHFREGARGVGLLLHKMSLRFAPTQYMGLLLEMTDKA